MTATTLRDRIAQALADACGCGEPDDGHRYEADGVLAGIDPADLGYEQVGFIWTTSQGVQWGGPEGIGHRSERPVYARPHTKETTDD